MFQAAAAVYVDRRLLSICQFVPVECRVPIALRRARSTDSRHAGRTHTVAPSAHCLSVLTFGVAVMQPPAAAAAASQAVLPPRVYQYMSSVPLVPTATLSHPAKAHRVEQTRTVERLSSCILARILGVSTKAPSAAALVVRLRLSKCLLLSKKRRATIAARLPPVKVHQMERTYMAGR